jgi:hypothetical protein
MNQSSSLGLDTPSSQFILAVNIMFYFIFKAKKIEMRKLLNLIVDSLMDQLEFKQNVKRKTARESVRREEVIAAMVEWLL